MMDYRNLVSSRSKFRHQQMQIFLPENIFSRPRLPDRIHPTAAGHKILAENVWRVLQPLLENGGS